MDRTLIGYNLGRVQPGNAGYGVNPNALAADGEALARLGNTIFNIGEDRKADQARTQLRDYFTGMEAEEMEFQNSWQERTDSSRFKVGDESKAYYQRKRKDIEKQFGWNSDAKEVALSKLANMEARGNGLAMNFVSKRRNEEKALSFQNSGAALLNFAAANHEDPTLVFDKLGQFNEDIQASYPEEKAIQLMRTTQDQTLISMLSAQSSKDPRKARQTLESLVDEEGNSLLSAAQQLKIADKIESDIRMVERQERAEQLVQEREAAKALEERAILLQEKLADANAYAIATGSEPEGYADLLATYVNLGGKYARQGQKLVTEMESRREMAFFLQEGQVDESGNLVPISQQWARVESLRPDEIEGASEQLQKYNIARDALTKRLKAFEKDPAGNVWDRAGRNVEAATTGLDITEEERLRMTIEKSLQMQEQLTGRPGVVLPEQVKRNLKSEFSSADTEGKLDFLRQLQGSWGNYSGRVINEMELPEGVDLIQELLPTAMDEDLRTLVAASTTRTADIPGSLKGKDLTNAVSSSDFLGLMQRVGTLIPANEAMQRRVSGLEDVTKNGAKLTGSSTGATILDKYYQTLNEDQIAVYFPKNMVSDAVEDQLHDRLNNLDQELAFKSVTLGKAGAAEYIEHIENNGVWITMDGRFVLLDPASQKLVTDAEGNALSLEFSQVKPSSLLEDIDLW
ncbi:hypothetical protein [Maridesulfovibrio sp.]|uniref:hypothetical protein n=1 Tax=Maridesulfovibrio sp. TaxID=2795000 RepID=UPI002A18A1F4|nr:hypothetical protein [Maridesulfovibrio sp.]